ncbi:MAG: hypothetical protein IJZ74_06735 [Clostridia bacterium]|nr:hypothetical protein [Clostridia bacterium]
MISINLQRSVDFLLSHAGPVIQYRLHREILRDVSPAEETRLLETVQQTPLYRQMESYRKPNGYIGIGMHSGEKYKETPLQDGEAAARLMAYYGIPRENEIVQAFVAALRDEETLRQEFSYCHAEYKRFENRYRGLRNGCGLMVLVYTMQALLGFDDEVVQPFVDTSYEAFVHMLDVRQLTDTAKVDENSRRRYNYPCMTEDAYFPCQYHLETLAHTSSWRTEERIERLARAVDHINAIMKPDDSVHVKLGGTCYVPYWAYCRTMKPFELDDTPHTALRKTITCLARATGDRTRVVQQSVANVLQGLQEDGVLRLCFSSPYRRKQFRDAVSMPSAYSEIGLETEHRSERSMWCELTFWAVQLLHILGYPIE